MSDLELSPETLDALVEAAGKISKAFLDFAHAVGYIYSQIFPVSFKDFEKNKKRELYLRRYRRRGERMRRRS